MGTWVLEDFYLPRTGFSSRKPAGDYLGEKLEICCEDGKGRNRQHCVLCNFYQHLAFYENDAESLYTLEMPSVEEGIYLYADGDGIRMEAGTGGQRGKLLF